MEVQHVRHQLQDNLPRKLFWILPASLHPPRDGGDVMRYPRNTYSVGETIMDGIGVVLVLALIAGFVMIGMAL